MFFLDVVLLRMNAISVLGEAEKLAADLQTSVDEIDVEINEITDRLIGLTKKSLESTKKEKQKAEKAIVQATAAVTKAGREVSIWWSVENGTGQRLKPRLKI